MFIGVHSFHTLKGLQASGKASNRFREMESKVKYLVIAGVHRLVEFCTTSNAEHLAQLQYS